MIGKVKWLFLAILVTIPMSALAFTGYSDEVVVLAEDQVINSNYYAAGNVVEVKGTVNGDIFVAGNTIIISSENINGDIFAAGSNITIEGKIDGSLRVVGENITLRGEVTRNVMSAGQNFRVDDNAKLAGHLTFWGQILNVAGEVGRIEGAFNNLLLTGKVTNDVDIYLAETVDNPINITDQAMIGGTLYYQALNKVDVNTNANIGDVAFNKIVKKEKTNTNGFRFVGWIIKFFGMLIVGMIMLQLWPKFVSRSYEGVNKKPIKTFFKGMLLLLVTPLAALLAAITIIGLPVAGIVMLLWFIALYLAKVLGAWFVGKFLKDKLFVKNKWHRLWILALGILVYILVAKIPLLGFLVIMIVYLLAWGSFYSLFKIKEE